MGCCSSCCLCKRKEKEEAASEEPKTLYSWDKKERVDRSLLIISDQEGGVVGRLPGQLNGRQFRIKNCRSTTILVLDHTDTVTVEKCVDCQIFVGPTKGSLYVRECTNCHLVIACQQFRARDCRKCTISLFSSTQPVIESSTKLKFTCFQGSYPQLNDQFKSIGLSVFNNCWSNIHDFDRGLGENNCALLPPGDSPPIISLPSDGEFSQVGLSLAPEMSSVPLTVGLGDKPEGEACLVVFFEKDCYEDRALEFSHRLHKKAVIVLTMKLGLESHQVEQLFPHNGVAQDSASKGEVVVLEVCGESCVLLCHQLLGGEEASTASVYVSPSAEQGILDTQALNSVVEISLAMQ